MFQKSLLILAIAACCAGAQAQATSSPAKKDLVARILKVQQPGVEALARDMVERPAIDMLGRAGSALPARVPAEKREAVAREIEGDVRKFVEDTVPLVRDRAIKLAPSTVGALLEEKFTEDELKQVVAMMESPVFAKFQSLGGEMQKVLQEKLFTDVRPQVAPKLQALNDSIARRLGMTPDKAPAGAASGAKPPARK